MQNVQINGGAGMDVFQHQTAREFIHAMMENNEGRTSGLSSTRSSFAMVESSCFVHIFSWMDMLAASENPDIKNSKSLAITSGSDICASMTDHVFQFLVLEVTRCHINHHVPLTKPLSFSRRLEEGSSQTYYGGDNVDVCFDSHVLYREADSLAFCLSCLSDAEFQIFTQFTLTIDGICSSLSHSNWEAAVVESSLRTLDVFRGLFDDQGVVTNFSEKNSFKTRQVDEHIRQVEDHVMAHRTQSETLLHYISYQKRCLMNATLASNDSWAKAQKMLSSMLTIPSFLKSCMSWSIPILYSLFVLNMVYFATCHRRTRKARSMLSILAVLHSTVRHAVCGSSGANERAFGGGTSFVDGSLCCLACVVLLISVLHSLLFGCKEWSCNMRRTASVSRSSFLEAKIEKLTRALDERLWYASNQIDHYLNEDISDNDSCEKSRGNEYAPRIMPVTPTLPSTSCYPSGEQELVLLGGERSRDDEFCNSLWYGPTDNVGRDTLETFCIPVGRRNKTCCVRGSGNVLSVQEEVDSPMVKVSHQGHHSKRKHARHVDDVVGNNPNIVSKRRKVPLCSL